MGNRWTVKRKEQRKRSKARKLRSGNLTNYPFKPTTLFEAGMTNLRSRLRLDPCTYCGNGYDKIKTLDHVKALSLGGKNGWENLTGSCSRCNSWKSGYKLLAFLVIKRYHDGRKMHGK